MTDIVSSVLPAIDRLVALGIVDPDRVGIIGHSDGGYEVASFLVQAGRLKAAVMVSGYGDLMGAYGFLDRGGANYNIAIIEGEWSNDPMGVKPWDNPLRYIENSPAYFLDRVQTPLLIFHGMNDTAVPAYASDQMFVGLRRLHKRVEYVKYEDEDHFQDYWSYQHKVDYYTRILDWFDRYLVRASR
jgi:dipeptidyl aminopeptidase/acylaminoacyl peptidase